MPSKWKRFGKVIVNLDRVVRVEQEHGRTQVYLAGLPYVPPTPLPRRPRTGEPPPPGSPLEKVRLPAPGERPGAYTFDGALGEEVWDYFDSLAK